jgi:hypothetical protein
VKKIALGMVLELLKLGLAREDKVFIYLSSAFVVEVGHLDHVKGPICS